MPPSERPPLDREAFHTWLSEWCQQGHSSRALNRGECFDCLYEAFRALAADGERLEWLERHVREIEFSQAARTEDGSRCGEAGRIGRPLRKSIDAKLGVEWNDHDELRELEQKRERLSARLAARPATQEEPGEG